jgi:flagellar basal-body rod protein FlgG
MIYGITTSALAAFMQEAGINVTANNLANLRTTGFRADTIAFQERLVEALEDRPDWQYYNATVDRYGGAPFIHKILFDRNPGPIEESGKPLDLAIDGKGFFAVRSLDTGKVFYTRAGNFRFDHEGRIVTANGKYQLLTPDREGILLPPEMLAQKITVDETGAIFLGTVQVTRLGLFDFKDYHKLLKFRDTLFEDVSGTPEPATGRIKQGFLEGSSAEPFRELSNMIGQLRILGFNIQMIRFQDSTLERLINDMSRLQR